MSFLRALNFDLLADTVSSYDQTKTTLIGRTGVKVIGGTSVVGPNQNIFLDTLTDATVTPIGVYKSDGRIYVIGSIVGGVAPILRYDITSNPLAATYMGRINVPLANSAATTHTLRAFKVDDSNTSNIKIFIATTGTVAVNGGLYLTSRIALSDFVIGAGTTISFLEGTDLKATSFLQDPSFVGATNNLTTATGAYLRTSGTEIGLQLGSVSAMIFARWDYSTAPSNPGQTVSSFTIASPGKVNITAHGFATNDQVVFRTTGTLPTGITAGTVYFCRNVTANDFEVSATSGGGSINFTGSATGTATVYRAFGITTNLPLVRTGSINTGLGGTLLANDSVDFAIPAHGSNSGQNCVAFATGTTIALGRISDLTAAATTWPTLASANAQGQTSQYASITVTAASWSDVLDRFVLTANGRFFAKQLVNNNYDLAVGATRLTLLNGVSGVVPPLGVVTQAGIDIEGGILVLGSSGTSQVGVIVCDLRADDFFDHSHVITKVLDTADTQWKQIALLSNYANTANYVKVYYRTSGFGSASGGWTAIGNDLDMSLIASSSQVQFKLSFLLGADPDGRFAQVGGGYLIHAPNNQSSDNWEYSQEFSSSGSPTRSAWRLKTAYSSTVPALQFYGRLVSTNAVSEANSTTGSPSNFEYSTNNGSSWNALGTIPNTVGTLVRYNWSTPPGADVRVALQEA